MNERYLQYDERGRAHRSNGRFASVPERDDYDDVGREQFARDDDDERRDRRGPARYGFAQRGRERGDYRGDWERGAMRAEDEYRRQGRGQGWGGDYDEERSSRERFGDRVGGMDWAQPRFAGGSQRESGRYEDTGAAHFGTGGYGQRQTGFGQERGFGQQRDWQRRGPHAGKGPKNYQRSDERVLEDVNHALEQDAEIDATEIEATCEKGIVVLRGTVDSRQARRAAEECVENLPGVKDVRNELRVQDQSQPGTTAGQSASPVSTGSQSSGGSSSARR